MALFTSEELTDQITAYKSALLALATAEEYTMRLPDGTQTMIRRSALPELRKHLEWLQTELDKLNTVAVGRTYAKQAGGGRW